ncbi:MAG: hypothetical protein WCI11_10125 [Candidatus Methylumidiphilus sp.]
MAAASAPNLSLSARAASRKRPADITDAWVIARDMRAKSAQMQRCARCASPFLVAYDCKLSPNCPFCHLVRQTGKAVNVNGSVTAENPASP